MADILKDPIEDVIQSLDDDQLKDFDIYADISERVLEIERTDRVDEALRLSGYLRQYLDKHPDLQQSYPDVYEQYRTLIIWLQYISFHVLLGEDLYTLLNKKLVLGITMDMPIRDKIKKLFQYSWDPFLQGEKRSMMLRALRENSEKLHFNMTDGGSTVPATVSRLIQDYTSEYGSDTRHGSLDEVRYMDSRPFSKSITPGQRAKALKILQIYDTLRFPPVQDIVENMIVTPLKQTESGAATTTKRGLPQTSLRSPLELEQEREAAAQTAPPQASIDPLEMLKQKYSQYRAQRYRVLQAEDELLVQTKGYMEEIQKTLSQAVRDGQRTRAMAALKILARQNVLVKALSSSPAWQQAVSDYIGEKYAQDYGQQVAEQAAADAKTRPTDPVVVTEFLQYVLKEKLRMSDNDSALVGVEISQLLGQPYQSIAYGNQETGSFTWAQHRIVKGRLVSGL